MIEEHRASGAREGDSTGVYHVAEVFRLSGDRIALHLGGTFMDLDANEEIGSASDNITVFVYPNGNVSLEL